MGDCVNFRRFFCHHDRTQGDANRRINRQLRIERDTYKSTVRLLLLGAGESGKSTIVKQMKILHSKGYTDEERKDMVIPIRRNLRDAMLAILGAMERLEPNGNLENAEEAWRVKYMFDVAVHLDTEYPPEFFEHCRELWKDAGVRRTFARSKEFHLIDSARYFLDQTDDLAHDDYLPSDQDILRCRILTSGIFETRFNYKNVRFHMFDVGGQRSEQRRWVQCFNDVTAIIFVSACSGYDLKLLEDPRQNRLKESLNVFRNVRNNKWLLRTPIILFLNKEDLLEEKIAAGQSNIEDYFPEFKTFHNNFSDNSMSPSERKLLRVKYFIESLFNAIRTAERNEICYTHFTCAVDTERMRTVFKDCKDIIQRDIINSIIHS